MRSILESAMGQKSADIMKALGIVNVQEAFGAVSSQAGDFLRNF
jgi:hypothetical protein